MIKTTDVQTQRWITTSTDPAKEMYLKYITPITPHQKDPRAVKVIPLLKLLFFINRYKMENALVLKRINYFIILRTILFK